MIASRLELIAFAALSIVPAAGLLAVFVGLAPLTVDEWGRPVAWKYLVLALLFAGTFVARRFGGFWAWLLSWLFLVAAVAIAGVPFRFAGLFYPDALRWLWVPVAVGVAPVAVAEVVYAAHPMVRALGLLVLLAICAGAIGTFSSRAAPAALLVIALAPAAHMIHLRKERNA